MGCQPVALNPQSTSIINFPLFHPRLLLICSLLLLAEAFTAPGLAFRSKSGLLSSLRCCKVDGKEGIARRRALEIAIATPLSAVFLPKMSGADEAPEFVPPGELSNQLYLGNVLILTEMVPPGVVHETPRDWTRLSEQLRKTMPKVDARSYYAWYHGHQVEHLTRARDSLAEQGCRSASIAERGTICGGIADFLVTSRFIYMLGDSTLDNKHWFFDLAKSKESQVVDPEFAARAECVNGFDHVLDPPVMVKDVAYWLNLGLEQRLHGPGKTCTLMTSVEESTIADRDGSLLEQDAFVRDHITKNDCLIVSIGGNDIALAPTFLTILNIFLLTRSPSWMIEQRIAPGFGYLVNLFGSRAAELTARVCSKQRPQKILLCMIYFLDQNPGAGWADNTLSLLGYNQDPGKLQLIIRTLFLAIREQRIGAGHPRSMSVLVLFVLTLLAFPDDGPLRRVVRGAELEEAGTSVHHMPLFTVLDPSDSANYVERVEPSVEGGCKMAEALLEVLLAPDSEAAIDAFLRDPPASGSDRTAA